jgi:hypothetical protein
VWIYATFFSVLFTVYPRSGEGDLLLFSQMNRMSSAAVAIFQLSFLGEPFEINDDFLTMNDAWAAMPAGQKAGVVAFFVCYVVFNILTVILLLNLLSPPPCPQPSPSSARLPIR